jgi:2-amino-4-hydroxy-6-hydroxymethyldihydropteridine diphosphokinase
MKICYLGMGSNLGNRKLNIKQALRMINLLRDTRVLKKSRLIQTLPVGGPLGQPKFLNAALKIKTGFSPLKLLRELKTIEKKLGRNKGARNGPREIDLDILLYGDKVIRSKKLVIPHPRMFSRDFVVKPLAQVL